VAAFGGRGAKMADKRLQLPLIAIGTAKSPSIKSNLIDEEYVPLVFGGEVVGEQQKSTLTYPKSIKKNKKSF